MDPRSRKITEEMLERLLSSDDADDIVRLLGIGPEEIKAYLRENPHDLSAEEQDAALDLLSAAQGAAQAAPLCQGCGKPVIRSAAYYEVQEGMHWVCFHYAFEHVGDPDDPCKDPSCPGARIVALEAEIRRLGIDPDTLGPGKAERR